MYLYYPQTTQMQFIILQQLNSFILIHNYLIHSMKESKQQQEDNRSIYGYLPRAKTLIEREAAVCISLFPQIKTPPFLEDEFQEVTPIIFSKPKQSKNNSMHNTIYNNFHEIFNKPIYKSSDLLICTNDNSTYGQLKFKINGLHQKKQQLLDLIPQQGEFLHFESRFESGNLAIAAKKAQKEYNLLIQKDINTNSCTQWFYFRINNKKQRGVFRFHILNFTKSYSAFGDGMQISIFSKKLLLFEKKGWHRGCFNIGYLQNTISRDKQNNYFTLSFSYNFNYQDDQVYFAYCYPYTYTRLQNFLDKIETQYPKLIHRKILATSYCGNHLQMLSITNFNNNESKQIMYISSRVHPGETVGSFICEGLINYLVSEQIQAIELRNKYIFKIIPMLNPDGVINGNYRCSLSGQDLNRCWQIPNKNLHPQIYYAKKMMSETKSKKILYLDLHAHSKKKSVFAYGCKNKLFPLECKQLPYIFHKKMKHFNFYYCNFVVSKQRQGTARIATWKQFNINNCLTIQTSFFGPLKENRHFSIKQYKQIGAELVQSLFFYFCKSSHNKSSQNLALTVGFNEVNQHLKELYNTSQLNNVGQQESIGSSEAQSLVEQLNSPKLDRKSNMDIKSPIRIRPNMINVPTSPKKLISSNGMLQLEKTQSNSPRRIKKIQIHNKHIFNYSELESFQKFISFNNDKLQDDDQRYEQEKVQNYQKKSSNILEQLRATAELSRRVHRNQRQSIDSQPNQRNHMNSLPSKNSLKMKSIIFPSSLRSQYTNYEKYKRDQNGSRGIINHHLKANESLSNRIYKKQIRSVEKGNKKLSNILDLKQKMRKVV